LPRWPRVAFLAVRNAAPRETAVWRAATEFRTTGSRAEVPCRKSAPSVPNVAQHRLDRVLSVDFGNCFRNHAMGCGNCKGPRAIAGTQQAYPAADICRPVPSEGRRHPAHRCRQAIRADGLDQSLDASEPSVDNTSGSHKPSQPLIRKSYRSPDYPLHFYWKSN